MNFKTTLLAAILAVAAFANANAASKIYVSTTSVPDADLDQAGYEALNWTEIRSIGSRGEMGLITNVLNYDTWDTTVIQKAKGMTDAGNADLEVARIPTDPGQLILRAAAQPGINDNYAFKEVRADGAGGAEGTVIYNRGLVVGLRRPGGRNEDFDIEVFQLAFQQAEIVTNPLDDGVAPTLTVAPAITGTLTVGETINLGNGTFTGDATITYERQLFAGGVAVTGATGATFDLTSAQLAKVLQLRVIARNDSGYAIGWSAVSAAVS